MRAGQSDEAGLVPCHQQHRAERLGLDKPLRQALEHRVWISRHQGPALRHGDAIDPRQHPGTARPPMAAQCLRHHAADIARRRRRGAGVRSIPQVKHYQAAHSLAVPAGLHALRSDPQYAASAAVAADRAVHCHARRTPRVCRYFRGGVKMRGVVSDVPYFHVVFTVPEAIATIAFQNQPVVYDILFQAASETLRTVAADPHHLGAEIGFLAVLHTWGQNLTHHPHLHVLVPGGGIAPDGESWIACRPGFFLPVRVLSRLFRRLFLHYLEKAFAAGELKFFSAHRHLHEPAAFRRYLAAVRNIEWVVYAKPPFAGPRQVLDYVGRYTHRVAISNNRMVSIDAGKVSFHWRDYRDGNRQKTMTLQPGEFIRRFLIHVLPDGFHRIRYYGFLGNCHRARKIERCRELLRMAPPVPEADPPADYRGRYEALTGRSLRECPHCRTGIMAVIETIPRPTDCTSVPDTS